MKIYILGEKIRGCIIVVGLFFCSPKSTKITPAEKHSKKSMTIAESSETYAVEM